METIIKFPAVVLSVMAYSISNEKGEIENDGCSVRYVATDSLKPCEDSKGTTKGYKPLKAAVPLGNFSEFTQVPALYEVVGTVSPDSSGKASFKPTEFKYMGNFTLSKSTTK